MTGEFYKIRVEIVIDGKRYPITAYAMKKNGEIITKHSPRNCRVKIEEISKRKFGIEGKLV